jgi:hypothetical protein
LVLTPKKEKKMAKDKKEAVGHGLANVPVAKKGCLLRIALDYHPWQLLHLLKEGNRMKEYFALLAFFFGLKGLHWWFDVVTSGEALYAGCLTPNLSVYSVGQSTLSDAQKIAKRVASGEIRSIRFSYGYSYGETGTETKLNLSLPVSCFSWSGITGSLREIDINEFSEVEQPPLPSEPVEVLAKAQTASMLLEDVKENLHAYAKSPGYVFHELAAIGDANLLRKIIMQCAEDPTTNSLECLTDMFQRTAIDIAMEAWHPDCARLLLNATIYAYGGVIAFPGVGTTAKFYICATSNGNDNYLVLYPNGRRATKMFSDLMKEHNEGKLHFRETFKQRGVRLNKSDRALMIPEGSSFVPYMGHSS